MDTKKPTLVIALPAQITIAWWWTMTKRKRHVQCKVCDVIFPAGRHDAMYCNVCRKRIDNRVAQQRTSHDNPAYSAQDAIEYLRGKIKDANEKP